MSSKIPILIKEDCLGTDELTVEFYHHNCGFEHVPRLQDNDFARKFGDPETTTATYCPGCGEKITWLEK